MSNEHDNDDEIRESIPCVSFWANEHGDGVALCLPVGYSLDSEGGVFCRGQRVSVDGGERRAWDDAITRERERRQRAGELPPPRKAVPIPAGEDTVQYLIRERGKAAAMLAEVISERDELRAKLERVRGAKRWNVVIQEARTGPSWDTAPGSDIGVRRYVAGEPHKQGCYVIWAELEAIVGKDGE
jgi:hypothetical protein